MTVSYDIRESPNHNARRAGPTDILLLHYTGMRSAEDALQRLCDPETQVSSHWVVDEDGRIIRLVDETRRAWHAGRAAWAGETDINSRSVGIEIVNPGHEFGYRAFAEPQIEALIDLCLEILSRHPIPPQRVLAHSDVAPDRKEDPGELFPWGRLHRAGIGHWVEPAPIVDGAGFEPGDTGEAVAALRRDLSSYGYPIEEGATYDAVTTNVVRAFQRHFRPALVDGIADASTRATLERLLAD